MHLRPQVKAQNKMISRLKKKEKYQDEQIRRLKEEVATSTKRIADLTAGWTTAISVASNAAADFLKIVSDNFVPEFPDVDCQEINLILVQVDMRAVDILTSAIEADETLADETLQN